MITVIDAILAINSNAKVTCDNENIDTIQWHDGTAVISKTDIEAKQAELQTAYDNNEYQRDRAIAYPEIKEQLDLLYKDLVAGKVDATGEWAKKIKKVKDDNPKE